MTFWQIVQICATHALSSGVGIAFDWYMGADEQQTTPAIRLKGEGRRIMESKPSWMRRLFGHLVAKPSNVLSAPQTPPQPAAQEDRMGQEAPAPHQREKRYDPAMSVPAVWKIGDVILGRYEVRGILGEGGMGTVYKIYHHDWDTEMAVKSPRPEIFTRAGGRENFMHEAQTWMNLKEHPHIVSCYFVETLGGIPRIFAEYVEGGNLADWIRERRLYQGGRERALSRMLHVAIQFAWGLHAAHEQGLVHQDVKPANVMMSGDGVAKVTDFGLAKARAVAGEGTMPGSDVEKSLLVSWAGLTPAYCSPEQAKRWSLSRKTDIWSWALCVLEMFVGSVTWGLGPLAREALASHVAEDPSIPVMPADVVKLLSRCFEPRPQMRPATMAEVARELQAIYARLVGHPYQSSAPQPVMEQKERLISQARSLRELGKLEEALTVCEQALHLDPTDPRAHKNKGVVLRDLGRLEEALASYEQAIRLDPIHPPTHYNKGNALRRLGRLEEALASYEQAIRLDPNFPFAHYNKGKVFQDLGRLEEVLLAYEQAIHLDPTHAKAHNNRGNTLGGLGRLEEALASYELVIRLDPTYIHAHYNKGVALRDLERFEEALAAFEQAIRLDPTDADTHQNQGNVLQRLGRLEEAELAYQRARAIYRRS
jgi:tetratricopeptide (TPR) repeat protein